jgi:hypothetical protein
VLRFLARYPSGAAARQVHEAAAVKLGESLGDQMADVCPEEVEP